MADPQKPQFDLEIELNGKPAVLKHKLSVLLKIGKEFGGPVSAHRAVMNFDLEAFTKIVAIGTERALPDAFDEVQAEVFGEGMESLQPQLIKFLNRLVSGGKDPTPTENLANLETTMAAA